MTLVSVMVVGAVGLAITTALLVGGIDDSRTSLVYERLFEAKALSSACAEEALQKIRNDAGFSGSGTVSMGQGSCTYAVTNDGGDARTILVEGSVGSVVRKARVTVSDIGAFVVVSDWKEVADF